MKFYFICIVLFLSNTLLSNNNKYAKYYKYQYVAFNAQEKGQDSLYYINLLKAYKVLPDKTKCRFFYSLIYRSYYKGDKTITKSVLSEMSCVYNKETIIEYIKTNITKLNTLVDSFEEYYNPKCLLKKEDELVFSKIRPKQDSLISFIIIQDQKVRNDTAKISKDITYIDSVNFVLLSNSIIKDGFPIYLDLISSIKFSVLLYHFDNIEKINKINNILLSAIFKGDLDPSIYAYSYDRSLINSGLRPKYFAFVKGTYYEKNYIPSKKEELVANKERAKIGLLNYPYYPKSIF